MKLRKITWKHGLLAALSIVAVTMPGFTQQAPSSSSSANSATSKPYLVEWVYKVKWGHADEFWEIFKKYQIATLNREHDLGYVTAYTVYRPGLHTGEDTRWEFRVVISYKDRASPGHGAEIEKELFPDRAAQKREENRRWEITEAHYDLPIHVINPNGDGSE